MIADCSSGCEPYYAYKTYKTVLDGTEFTMYNKWLQKLQVKNGESLEDTYDKHKSLFKGAEDIHWSDHVKMQAELQKYIDSSISKTINMPEDTTVSEVKEAYELAYKLGCKGITVYRTNSRSSCVLSTKGQGEVAGGDLGDSRRDNQETDRGGEKSEAGNESHRLSDSGGRSSATWPPELYKLDLPDTAKASRYRVSVDNQKVYILVTEGPDGDPLEIFVKFAYESDPVWNVLCRQLSLALRYGVPLEEIVKQLDKAVVGVGDMSAKLSRILKRYLDGGVTTRAEDEDSSTGVHATDESYSYDGGSVNGAIEAGGRRGGKACPECGESLVAQGGCFSCPGCYWEKCS
jgi:ribonucleoside-diphosphate reductase alpha chain